MTGRWILAICVAFGCGAAIHGACAQSTSRMPEPSDSGYAATQARGRQIVGADEYRSMHQFDLLPDGGRIALQRDSIDSIGTARIRDHMRQVATAFAAGDFSAPGFVHHGEVPGTALMAEKRQVIAYDVRKLPGGAEVVMTSSDTAAVNAIHNFVLYQQRQAGTDRPQ